MMTTRKIFCWFLIYLIVLQAACSRAGSGGPVPGQEQAPQFKPGFNLLSPEQDVEIGRKYAAQIEREMRVLPDPAVQQYINNIGKRLAAVAPGEKFPYQFKVVDVKEINAFALPGGFLYVHIGAIVAAKNESELAGVMAHEISHAALRHGTNQMSKQMVAEKGLGVASAILGNGREGGTLGDAVLGAGANLLFLRFSRTAEKQADIMGAQLLASAGYDPRGLGEFFKTLMAQGARPPQLLSDHPDPGNRIQYLNELMPQLKLTQNPIVDTPEFQELKNRVRGLPGGRDLRRQQTAPSSRPMARPAPPSPQQQTLQAQDGTYALSVPSNWQMISAGNNLTIFAPQGAAGKTDTGSVVVTHGVFVGTQDLPPNLRDLEQASKAFVELQLRDNPEMRVLEDFKQTKLDGLPALYIPIGGESPVTGRQERDLICTTILPNGKLFYLVLISPADEVQAYNPAFLQTLESVRFAR
ncbi:MAG TPA: M48 family metallopeptidase [Blastocatellia bacterium]|nr:M48 family metallopeptidase [Blastocatellia bacterium]